MPAQATWIGNTGWSSFMTPFRGDDHRAPVLLQVRVGNFAIVHLEQSDKITKASTHLGKHPVQRA
jgi:hypothetical protein